MELLSALKTLQPNTKLTDENYSTWNIHVLESFMAFDYDGYLLDPNFRPVNIPDELHEQAKIHIVDHLLEMCDENNYALAEETLGRDMVTGGLISRSPYVLWNFFKIRHNTITEQGLKETPCTSCPTKYHQFDVLRNNSIKLDALSEVLTVSTRLNEADKEKICLPSNVPGFIGTNLSFPLLQPVSLTMGFSSTAIYSSSSSSSSFCTAILPQYLCSPKHHLLLPLSQRLEPDLVKVCPSAVIDSPANWPMHTLSLEQDTPIANSAGCKHFQAHRPVETLTEGTVSLNHSRHSHVHDFSHNCQILIFPNKPSLMSSLSHGSTHSPNTHAHARTGFPWVNYNKLSHLFSWTVFPGQPPGTVLALTLNAQHLNRTDRNHTSSSPSQSAIRYSTTQFGDTKVCTLRNIMYSGLTTSNSPPTASSASVLKHLGGVLEFTIPEDSIASGLNLILLLSAHSSMASSCIHHQFVTKANSTFAVARRTMIFNSSIRYSAWGLLCSTIFIQIVLSAVIQRNVSKSMQQVPSPSSELPTPMLHRTTQRLDRLLIAPPSICRLHMSSLPPRSSTFLSSPVSHVGKNPASPCCHDYFCSSFVITLPIACLCKSCQSKPTDVFYSLVPLDYKHLPQAEDFVRLPNSAYAKFQFINSNRLLSPLLDYTAFTILIPLTMASLINFASAPLAPTKTGLLDRLTLLKPGPLTFAATRLVAVLIV